MKTPLVLLKFIGKAVLNAIGAGILGDLALDVVPAIAQDVWEGWGKQRTDEQRQADIEAVVQASTDEVRQQAVAIAKEVAADRPAEIQQALSVYLIQVPATIRKSLRRPSDPSGKSVPAYLLPRKPQDLIPLLPPKLPRFSPGQQPLPGVDLVLEELLGVGGFGEVWKARNPHMTSIPSVALKFCLDSDAARLLRNEAGILDRVMREGKHPGIVQLQHTYLSSSIPCLEYEYVDGGDLTGVILEWHRSQGGATVDQAARTIHRLAEIVGYAHRLTPPIVHRDLKPANILVHKTADNEPYFKVADFGIGGVAAGRAIQQATQGSSQGHFLVSSLRGSCTELYASPQQRQGDLPDPRDDVFALGVIWYQLLTGRLDSGRPGGSRWKQSLADKGMSSWMVKVLERCLEDNPDDRPKDAATLAKAIPRIYVLSGKSFFEDEEYGQAIRDVTIALTLDPELANVECYRIRGIAYCECEQWDEAISDLTNWIRFAPNSPEAFVWKGEAYAGKEAYDEAICDLSEAIRQDTSHLKAYCSRGDVFRVTGDYQRAIADYTDALALVENDDARQNYILLYARFYTTLHDDLTASNNALVGCRYSLRQQVLFDRASCYEDLGDLENALNDYRRSECGYDEAIAVCNRLIDADPGRATELQPMIDNLVSRRDRHLRSGKGTHSHERIHDPLE